MDTKGFEVISSKHYWWINFVKNGRPIRQNDVGGLQSPREREREMYRHMFIVKATGPFTMGLGGG